MDLLARPITNPVVIFKEQIDNWAVLINLDTAASVALNPTGVVIWKMVDKNRNVSEIVTAVKNHFNNAPDTVADDVASLLGELAEGGFVGYEEKL
ncbi:MAG: PqqD family peptide modification chaperone [Anaerolineales bacterium]